MNKHLSHLSEVFNLIHILPVDHELIGDRLQITRLSE
jgi:hypothetical protein